MKYDKQKWDNNDEELYGMIQKIIQNEQKSEQVVNKVLEWLDGLLEWLDGQHGWGGKYNYILEDEWGKDT